MTETLTAEEQHEVYKTVFEVAIINASLSKMNSGYGPFARSFAIDDDEHNLVESELRDMVKERFEIRTWLKKHSTHFVTQSELSQLCSTMFEKEQR